MSRSLYSKTVLADHVLEFSFLNFLLYGWFLGPIALSLCIPLSFWWALKFFILTFSGVRTRMYVSARRSRFIKRGFGFRFSAEDKEIYS